VNCRRIQALLSAYLDNELTGYEMLAIREHVSYCQKCSEERDAIESVRSMMRSLPQHHPRPELLTSLQRQAFFAGLPWGTRLRLMFAQDPDASFFQGRRAAATTMLAAIGIFMVAAAHENTPSVRPTGLGSTQFAAVAQRRPMAILPGNGYGPPPLLNQEIQFLDPRQHPADLPNKESSLTLYNVLGRQSRYNNVTLTSYTSLGNQLISLR